MLKAKMTRYYNNCMHIPEFLQGVFPKLKKVQNEITVICPSVSPILVHKLQLINGHLHAAETMCSTMTHMKKKYV